MQRRSSLVPLVLIGAVIFGTGPLVTLVTDATWFGAAGYGPVFRTMMVTRIVLGLAMGVVAFGLVGGSGLWAARVTAGQQPSPRMVRADNPVGQVLAATPLTTLTTVLGLFVAMLSGLAASTWWGDVLLAKEGVRFGFDDPVYALDASFYIFVLPLVMEIRSALATLLFVALLVSVGVYVTHGGARLKLVKVPDGMRAEGVEVLPGARNHVALLASVMVLLMALGAYLQRYTLLYDQGGLFAGPGYADLFGTMPLLTVQAVAMVGASFGLWVGLSRMNVLALSAAGALALLGNGLSSVYPGLLQRFSVDPNELTREGPQIVDHIEATRHAFDLDTVVELPLSGEAQLTREDIEANHATIENVRLWDHRPLLETFAQVQEIRTYYEFQSVDNDRYRIDGDLRQGARQVEQGVEAFSDPVELGDHEVELGPFAGSRLALSLHVGRDAGDRGHGVLELVRQGAGHRLEALLACLAGLRSSLLCGQEQLRAVVVALHENADEHRAHSHGNDHHHRLDHQGQVGAGRGEQLRWGKPGRRARHFCRREDDHEDGEVAIECRSPLAQQVREHDGGRRKDQHERTVRTAGDDDDFALHHPNHQEDGQG